MSNKLFNSLISASIPVLDNSNSIISYGFILEFSIDEKNALPFLVLNYNDVKDLDYAVLGFHAIKDGKKVPYNVSFSKSFIEQSKVNDFIIHPIANLFNEASSKGVKIECFGMNAKYIIDFDNPQTRSIEDLYYSVYKLINGNFVPIIKKTYNSTLFYEGNREYFLIEDNGVSAYGFPLVIANEGAFYNGKDLCAGTRVLFAGFATKSIDGMIVINYPYSLMSNIREKFANLFSTYKIQ